MFTGCERTQFVLGIEEKFSMARTWPVSPRGVEDQEGTLSQGPRGFSVLSVGISYEACSGGRFQAEKQVMR